MIFSSFLPAFNFLINLVFMFLNLLDESFGEDYCTIHPLNEKPSRTNNTRGLPTLKEKGQHNKVPEWLNRNDNQYNHHKRLE